MTDLAHLRAVAFGSKPLASLSSPREVVRQFTPNWFAATMGTGILALALAQFPANVPGLHAVAEGLWLFNIGLFSLFTALYAARWIFYFDGARQILGHSVVSMFFGCIPMGLATIINGFLAFGIPHWGHAAVIWSMLWLWRVNIMKGMATPQANAIAASAHQSNWAISTAAWPQCGMPKARKPLMMVARPMGMQ
ncbi:MAG: hypothetical protein EON94_06265, partial [Caulobacteraceae bacterium]